MHLLLKIVAKALSQQPAFSLLVALALALGTSAQTRTVTATIDPGTHVSAVADRFQNHVLPSFSKNLCFTTDCR